ncbi:baseplate multidomain protein megatron [Pelagibacterium lacus]|uniref:Host specificity protein n=1 Tax=Pelagibacterium lacus TaxID=2282655 RepID=A0A369W7Z6_9HYPH|nr:glycoside hydrolase/phage tail family protein [Pelagibacterium lacus]RDE10463.1 hypothetical protein DVH29_00475 [Pelagibacterium lacus]
MATLALSLVGQVVGGVLGGPLGATLGRALGGLAGSAVDSALFGEKPRAATGSDIRLTGSHEGRPIPRVYGWSRLAGNIIWASQLERRTAESAGSKGLGNTAREEIITASFAVALCEGEVAHLGRIWADGRLLETDGLNIRFYRGTRHEAPDGLIVAKQGHAPAYRGLCYMVFEQLDLSGFGNRIPNISVEVCRPVGDLEPAISGVCVVPGATEFGYDPTPRVRVLGGGRTEAENTHMEGSRSDWDLSIGELAALCPNLRHVGLVVAWFGTDLRCGHCVVEPRVEAAGRQIKGTSWAVAGRGRAAAGLVSRVEGAPAYGGTPSDASVLAAIADLKARGIAVTLYPFVMMDIAAGNALPDPYTGHAGQPAYPWRGRITCHPAPGRTGSPDGTPAAATQVAGFMANGYREMILHYADLARRAGGVDALLIGSEMRHLTWVRSGPETFPFVDALRGLAGEVRAIVGAGTKITYAADWSEYSGLQPEGTGDKIFHLDPLWADGNIDAVAIDAYMPLADWRDGAGHLDAETARSIHDLEYLKANIAGGEGFNWYYADEEARRAQDRTPIADGAHGEDWIWRYKDLVSWWSQAHHNRIGGVRQTAPTPWVPRSKPIWLTELGCGAVDKGPNGPNAFGDPKSAEHARPPFSSGAPDALVQRQTLRACHQYWRQAGAHNPVSPHYGGKMLDPDRIYLWCWDARPYPAFPGLTEIWSDGANYPTGHWLNGRLGAAAPDEIIAAMAADYGVPVGRIDAAPPLVAGLGVEAVTDLRSLTEPLADMVGLATRDGGAGMEWIVPDARHARVIAPDALARGEGPVLSRKRGDPADMAGRLTLNYFDRDLDYRTASVLVVSPDGRRHTTSEIGLALAPEDARLAVESALRRLRQAGDTLETALPPSLLALEAGDVVAIAGIAGGPFRIDALRDGATRRLSGSAHAEGGAVALPAQERRWSVPQPAIAVQPVFAIAHLPGEAGGSELVAAAFADPWPGPIGLRDPGTGSQMAEIAARGTLGVLAADLAPGPVGLWSREQAIVVDLFGGHLASVEPLAVLGGANRLAVETDRGWELIGFADAHLLEPRRYRLTGLLRGLAGTVPGFAEAGRPVLVAEAASIRVPVPQGDLGETRALRAYAGPRDAEGIDLTVTLDRDPALPLAPAHPRARKDGATGDIVFNWVRRGRVGGNEWTFGDIALDVSPERYRLRIMDGGTERRSVEVATPGWTYKLAAQTEDFGAAAAGFTFTVQQVSPVLGAGLMAFGEFP